jgi:hypothetical protein
MPAAPTDFLVQSLKNPRGLRVVDRVGRVLAELRQPSIWSKDMEGTAGGIWLRIASEGFWRARYGVFIAGVRSGTITTGIWGTLRLSLTMKDAPSVDLQFARAGFFRSGYQLRLAKDLPLLELKPVFRWSTFLTDFAVQARGPGIAPEQQPLILALSGFCARLLRSRAKSAAAAT